MKKLMLLLFFTAFSFTVFCQAIYQVGGHTLKSNNGAWTEIVEGVEIPLLTNLVILKFDESLSQRDIDLLAETYNIRQVYSNPRGFYTFDISGSNYVTLLTNLHADNSISIIELNHEIPLMSPPNDSYDLIYELVLLFPNLLWPYNNTDLYEAWELTTGNPAVTVAIIDNGLYIDHEDLNLGTDNYSNIWMNLPEKNGIAGEDDDGNGKNDDFFGWDFIDKDNSVMHDHFIDGHGTRIAGIIGAKTNNEIGVYGIAGGARNEGVKLMGLKVGGSGDIQSVAVHQAIDYAVENGAKIINMSFGGMNYPS